MKKSPERIKALEIIADMQNTNNQGKKLSLRTAKRCALVAVNETIQAITSMCLLYQDIDEVLDYWEKVKNEIEKI